MTQETPKKSGTKLIGVVTSNKMTNTVKVKVDQVKVHPKYQKRYRMSQKFAADTAGEKFEIGDKVEIIETRPMSKTKNWKVVRKVSKLI
jgi:small subunit ribosomal protein S17